MAQKGTGRFSENVIRTDKSALLWMYCREIAPLKLRPLARMSATLSLAQRKRPSEMRNRSEANRTLKIRGPRGTRLSWWQLVG